MSHLSHSDPLQSLYKVQFEKKQSPYLDRRIVDLSSPIFHKEKEKKKKTRKIKKPQKCAKIPWLIQRHAHRFKEKKNVALIRNTRGGFFLGWECQNRCAQKLK